MRFKLIIAIVDDERTDVVLQAAREAGSTGATVLAQARGEGLRRGDGAPRRQAPGAGRSVTNLQGHVRAGTELIVEVGDVLALAGSQEAVAAAMELLGGAGMSEESGYLAFNPADLGTMS